MDWVVGGLTVIALLTWLVVTQTGLPRLNGMLRARLRGALLRILELYRDGEGNPFALTSSWSAPNKAFVDAEIVELP